MSCIKCNLSWLFSAAVQTTQLLLLTGFAGYGGQYFTNLGLQRETAATGTLATSSQIVWTYLFELTFLHEGINGWSLAGTALILGFMIVVGYLKLSHDTTVDHPTVSGEAEQTAFIYSSSRSEGPALLELDESGILDPEEP